MMTGARGLNRLFFLYKTLFLLDRSLASHDAAISLAVSLDLACKYDNASIHDSDWFVMTWFCT